jgi:alpha-tubulin suppressor-like RCC1 family protein
MPAPFGLPAELAELQDDYELLGELGRGGSAVVYRARDRALGRDVAVKVVHPRPTSPDDDPVARLGREARTVAQLQHPNIVAVYAVRRLRGGGLALVMQCVPGATLKTHVQRHGPLAPDACERLLRDVGAALAYAHARGVVHRDVKPENIFLDEASGRALLADFGIARSADADSMTMTGTAVGTPFYMSPEQVEGAALDGRSDLYSLGLVAWEALTGRRPWDGESLYNVIYKQKHEELPPIEALRDGVPLRLQYVVERMLQKRPAARWAGAEGLLAQLGHAVLPGDYTRWQRALHARVARYHDESARRAAERPAPTATGTATRADAPAAATIQFDRASLGAASGRGTAASGDSRRDGGTAHAAAALANTAVVPIGATAAPAVDAPPPGPDGSRADVAPAHPDAPSAGHGGALLPEPGHTVDLQSVDVRDAGLPAAALPVYADAAEPSWAEEPRDADAAGRPVPVARRRRAVYVGGAAVAVACAALALYSQLAAAPAGQPAAAYAAAATSPFGTRGGPDRGAEPNADVGGDRGGSTGAFRATPDATPASLVSAGGRHTCAATPAGPIRCWGANERGQLGDGTGADRATPVAVAGVLAFTSVSSGLAHSCAVTRLGDVYCWGADSRGQLGDATTIRRSAPVRVAGPGTYTAVSAGAAHSCAVTAAAALRCWGANDQGQLGDGTRDSRLVPTTVALNGADVAQVAAGGQHTCALTGDGRIQCWGANRDGQLGDGTTGGSRPVPAPVGLPGRAVHVSTGLAHSCALTADGAAWCWGRNEAGQLGDGSRVMRSLPVRVAGDGATRFAQIAAGGTHSCAVDAGGAVWCWGQNTRGAVGDGSTTARERPVRVALPGRAEAVATGTAHSCARLTDGRAFCWGSASAGQLGDSARVARRSPVAVR